MTWSREEAIEQRKCAVRFLLDTQQDQFTRSLEWIPQQRTNVPLGIWTLLYEEELVVKYACGHG